MSKLKHHRYSCWISIIQPPEHGSRSKNKKWQLHIQNQEQNYQFQKANLMSAMEVNEMLEIILTIADVKFFQIRADIQSSCIVTTPQRNHIET